MKIFLWSGLLFVIGSIAWISNGYGDLKVQKNGTLVKMTIKKLPNSCLGTKVKHFVTLSYAGNNYIKRIGGKFCDEHHVGEMIDMKTLPGSSTILFPNESVLSNLLADAVLGLFGLLLIIYYWKTSKI